MSDAKAPNSSHFDGDKRSFPDTPWTMLMVAQGDSGQAERALNEICQSYWYPIYAFVRRSSYSATDAEDMTQSFFGHLLGKSILALATREKGRLRSFLIRSLKNFMANEWRKSTTAKRGGGERPLSLDLEGAEVRYAREPSEGLTPDRLFVQKWTATILEEAAGQLQLEYRNRGKEAVYDALRPHMISETGEESYGKARELTGLSGSALRVAVHRMRKRFKELLMCQVASTVTSADDVPDELAFLMKNQTGPSEG